MVQVELTREKETRRTVRFVADDTQTGRPLEMVYVPKSTLAGLGDPERLTVQIAAAT